MQEPILHNVAKVTATPEPGVIVALADVTDGKGEREEANYCVRPDDPYGLAPIIRQWLDDHPDFPVDPYVPPTAEEIRAKMPAITPRQLRLTLVRNGYSLASVDAAINGLPDGPAKDEASIEWEYGTMFDRTSLTLQAVAGALEITPEQVDTMWSEALAI